MVHHTDDVLVMRNIVLLLMIIKLDKFEDLQSLLTGHPLSTSHNIIHLNKYHYKINDYTLVTKLGQRNILTLQYPTICHDHHAVISAIISKVLQY